MQSYEKADKIRKDKITTSGALFSDDRVYRYVLWRVWDRDLPMVGFIGLNPSTADEFKDDPTMRRCASFAKSWGYGGFYMANLFGFRATKPEELRLSKAPIGLENDFWILEVEKQSQIMVFAWGVHGTFLNRNMEIVSLVKKGYFIELTKDGHPRHPLYLKGGLNPKKF